MYVDLETLIARAIAQAGLDGYPHPIVPDDIARGLSRDLLRTPAGRHLAHVLEECGAEVSSVDGNPQEEGRARDL